MLDKESEQKVLLAATHAMTNPKRLKALLSHSGRRQVFVERKKPNHILFGIHPQLLVAVMTLGDFDDIGSFLEAVKQLDVSYTEK